MSGVTTHVNLLLGSPLAGSYELRHFQVGSEGRVETPLGRLGRLAASPFRLLVELVRSNAAVLHVNTSLNARAYWRDLAYVAAAKLCGAKVVYQVHGGALPQDFFAIKLFNFFLKATLRAPDVVVVLASAEQAAYREFVPGQCLLTMPNGIDCTPFLKRNRQRPDPKAPLKLAYVGRLAREKGLHEALDALVLLRSRGSCGRLLIAGGGPEEAALRRRVLELGLQRDVVFAGAVEGERKAKLLGNADVLLLPSYAEGLPYALLEGMAAGAVPVATGVGAIPDVVTDGTHGKLIPPREPAAIAQAIEGLAADRAQLARMSAACRKRISGAYSIERLAADLGSLYAGLLAARVPKAVL
jgi:glycosyltransferase involved in cell wall biosynthesis